jgi:catechol 2,3-dioxygenase-like lactoylglutathione lyase family enzyme
MPETSRIRGRAENGWWGTVLDAPDPSALARFYAELLGWRIHKDEGDYATIAPAEGVTYLGFQFSENYVAPVWPNVEGRQQMQLHLDLEVLDLDGAVEDALTRGARLAEFQPQDDVRVMLDPVGHPFCLYLGTDD